MMPYIYSYVTSVALIILLLLFVVYILRKDDIPRDVTLTLIIVVTALFMVGPSFFWKIGDALRTGQEDVIVQPKVEKEQYIIQKKLKAADRFENKITYYAISDKGNKKKLTTQMIGDVSVGTKLILTKKTAERAEFLWFYSKGQFVSETWQIIVDE